MHNVRSSGRKEATIGDMLVSIMSQEDSFAKAILEEAGVTKLSILEYISHSEIVEIENISDDEDEVKEFPNLRGFYSRVNPSSKERKAG